MQNEYRSKDIQRIAKISKDKLVHWTRIGIIRPLQDAEGRGARRVYSYRNLIEAMICRELNELHVETQTIRGIIIYMGAPIWPPESEGEKFSFWELLEKYPERVHDAGPFLVIMPSPFINELRESKAIHCTIAQEDAVTIYLLKHSRTIVINLEKILREAEVG